MSAALMHIDNVTVWNLADHKEQPSDSGCLVGTDECMALLFAVVRTADDLGVYCCLLL